MEVAKVLLIIHTLVSSQSDWDKFKKHMEVMEAQAEVDGTDTSMQTFLDRKLIDKCASCKNKEEDIKEILYIVAMFHEKDCKLPEKGDTFIQHYKDKLFDIVVKAIKEHLEKEDESPSKTSVKK